MNQAKLPFRTTVRQASPTEAPDASKQQLSLFSDDVAFIISEIRGLTSDHADSQIMRWIEHPDERVPLALVNLRAGVFWAFGVEATERVQALYDRAIKDAGGLCWTPLIDAMATKGIWPVTPATMRRRMGNAWFGGDGNTWQTARDRAHDLIPWIELQQDPESLRQLLAFRYGIIRHLLLQHGRALTPELIREVLNEDPKYMMSLSKNESLKEEWVIVALEFALEQPRGGEVWRVDTKEGFLALCNALGYVPPGYIEELVKMGASSAMGSSSALDLLLNLPGVETEHLEAIAPRVRQRFGGQALAKLLVHPAATPEMADRIFSAESDPLDFGGAVIEFMAAPESLLIAAASHCDFTAAQWESLVRHPKADLELWRLISSRTGSHSVRFALSRTPKACRDPGVRLNLSRTTSSDLLLYLLRNYGDGADLALLFPRVARMYPREALEVIANLPEDVEGVPAAMLMPYLKSSNPTERELAIRALARVPTQGAEEATSLEHDSTSVQRKSGARD